MEASKIRNAIADIKGFPFDVGQYERDLSNLKSLVVTGLRELVPEGSQVVYIGHPYTDNVGDQLITLGTLAFLRINKLNIAGVSSAGIESSSIKAIRPDVTILMHGGGNFGDLYLAEQRLREEVIKKYPENRIICLPQSLHFQNESGIRSFSEIAAKHRDLHLVWRESFSYEFARNRFEAKSYLIPDMAVVCWPFSAAPSPLISRPMPGYWDREPLWALRRDGETTDVNLALQEIIKNSWDWQDLYGFGEGRRLHVGLEWVERLNTPFESLLLRVWERMIWRFVNRTIRHFSNHSVVITSRLHVHILSVLLGKPSIVLNNSYGKNERYFNTWDKTLQIHRLVE